ncbi:hypothetical protein PQX77_011211, partial [Marasmius sp. AFHP31]
MGNNNLNIQINGNAGTIVIVGETGATSKTYNGEDPAKDFVVINTASVPHVTIEPTRDRVPGPGQKLITIILNILSFLGLLLGRASTVIQHLAYTRLGLNQDAPKEGGSVTLEDTAGPMTLNVTDLGNGGKPSVLSNDAKRSLSDQTLIQQNTVVIESGKSARRALFWAKSVNLTKDFKFVPGA